MDEFVEFVQLALDLVTPEQAQRQKELEERTTVAFRFK